MAASSTPFEEVRQAGAAFVKRYNEEWRVEKLDFLPLARLATSSAEGKPREPQGRNTGVPAGMDALRCVDPGASSCVVSEAILRRNARPSNCCPGSRMRYTDV